MDPETVQGWEGLALVPAMAATVECVRLHDAVVCDGGPRPSAWRDPLATAWVASSRAWLRSQSSSPLPGESAGVVIWVDDRARDP